MTTTNPPPRLRLGMVGGGAGAYIGGIHRIAARLDGQFEWVAGAFDIDPARGHAFAAANYIEPSRSYDDYRAMVAAERVLVAANHASAIDVVAICTPNHTHFPIAKAFNDAHKASPRGNPATKKNKKKLCGGVPSGTGFVCIICNYSGDARIPGKGYRILL